MNKIGEKIYLKIIVIFSLVIVAFMIALIQVGCAEEPKDEGTKWYQGTENIENMNEGKAGDFYIDTDDYILYQKNANGTWAVVMTDYGKPGESNYVWVKYADDMPNSNEDMKDEVSLYIGIYNGTSSIPPIDYTQYTWNKIVGEKGEQGQSGQNGNSVYIRYATEADGSDMKDEFTDDCAYIGVYVGQTDEGVSCSAYDWVYFREINYSINYVLNRGTNNCLNPLNYTQETPTITLLNPEREGYIFKGWFDNQQFNGSELTNIEKGSKGDITLYAKWEIIPHEYFNSEILIAHRGSSMTAPENTIVAIEIAKNAGLKIVEVDIQMTKDNVPVLLHDNLVDRTSDGSGSINSFTLEEVKALDFGSWKGATFAGEKIPTLEEVLDYCNTHNLIVELDLANRSFTDEQIAIVYNTVAEAGALQRTIFTAEDEALQKYVEIDNAIIVSVAWIMNTSVATNILPKYSNCSLVLSSTPHEYLTQELVDYVQETLNMKVKTWTINSGDAQTLEKAMNLGVDFILSDDITSLSEE